MTTIGITGGIGSGKSYISMLLRQMAVPVYDCDTEAKRLTASNPDIRAALKALVGNDVYNGEALVKERLAAYLFANADNAARVNAIIHPAVLRDFKEWAVRQQSPVVAMESAILYESGFDKHVDKVLLVDAPEDVRLQRAMQRDGASEAQIRARMQQQQHGRHHADYVIQNHNQSDAQLVASLRQQLGLH